MHVKGYGSLFAKKICVKYKKIKCAHKRKLKNHDQNL